MSEPITEEKQEPKTNHTIMYIGLGLIISILFLIVLNLESKVNFLEKKLLSNTELLYHHDEYIVGKITKEHEAREIAKHNALKLYMETGDKSAMIKLGMK